MSVTSMPICAEVVELSATMPVTRMNGDHVQVGTATLKIGVEFNLPDNELLVYTDKFQHRQRLLEAWRTQQPIMVELSDQRIDGHALVNSVRLPAEWT